MISVIIPAKDAASTLEACLGAVLHQDRLRFGVDYEVLVVDDGSTDETAPIAQRMGVATFSQPNAGPAAARNLGAQHASGDLLVFTDADCVPEPDWLLTLSSAFTDGKVVAAKGAYLTRERGPVPRFVQCEYAHKYERMARLEAIDFVDTYSAAYRRDIFLQNGGFDPLFREPSVEDQELSFRLARKGYRMVFCPAARVAHSHDRNIGEYVHRKFGIGYWKAVMMNWMPEKAFADSHTPASQRWQIVLLCAALAAAVAGVLWPGGLWISLAFVVLFILTTLGLMRFILRYDPGVLWISPVMLLLRAASLAGGIVWGLIKRPAHLPHKGLSLSQRLIKRAMDLIGSISGLVLSAPLLLIAAVAIRLDSPGPILFGQLRAGENGRPFRILKLRSMVAGAEERVEEVIDHSTLRGPAYKVPNDPRVTRVGKFLRRWSLDEIPQFWNVLKGEMSLVGPRPEEIWVVERYNDAQRQRLVVKPGMTGPMQISGRGDLDMEERLRLELDYIAQYSLGLDLLILLRSIPAVISCKGAY